MTESTGKTGKGITLEVSDGQSPTPTWTKIANVVSINPSGLNAEEIDFTHLESDSGYREFRQGFKDAGSLGVNYHFDPSNATHTDLMTKFAAGTVFDGRVNFSGAGWAYAMNFRGFVQNPGDIDINVDGPVSGSATIRRTGPTAFVAV